MTSAIDLLAPTTPAPSANARGTRAASILPERADAFETSLAEAARESRAKAERPDARKSERLEPTNAEAADGDVDIESGDDVEAEARGVNERPETTDQVARDEPVDEDEAPAEDGLTETGVAEAAVEASAAVGAGVVVQTAEASVTAGAENRLVAAAVVQHGPAAKAIQASVIGPGVSDQGAAQGAVGSPLVASQSGSGESGAEGDGQTAERSASQQAVTVDGAELARTARPQGAGFADTPSVAGAPPGAGGADGASLIVDASPAPPTPGSVSASAAALQATEASSLEATGDAEETLNAARLSRGLNSALNQRNGSVTLRLTPPELGTVRIQLQVQGTSVAAQFHAETDRGMTLLTQQLAQLRSSLEAQGLSVDRLGVQALTSPNSTGQSNLHQQGEGNASQQQAEQEQGDGRSRGRFFQQRDPLSPEHTDTGDEPPVRFDRLYFANRYQTLRSDPS